MADKNKELWIKDPDLVKVVRCKNCKNWSNGVRGCTDHVKFCSIGYYMIGENGYCSFGERRNGDDQTTGEDHPGIR